MKNIATGLCLSMAIVTSVMANEQVVTLDSSLQNLYSGESFDLAVNYSVTNQASVSGLGIKVFFDSSVLSLSPIINVFGEGKIAQAIQHDKDDLDNDPMTDTYVNISWMSFSGQWPMQMPEMLELTRLNFTTSDDFKGTSIHVDKSSNAAGYEFVGQSLYISAN